jgi:lysozyme family protein
MAITNFDRCLALVLAHEGGFVNHPQDPGGATNLGVTKAVWQEWRGRPVTTAEMRRLKPIDVEPLYRRRFWDRVRGDDLPLGVDYCVFDAAVNSGPGRAAKWLQEVLGVPQDGAVGLVTLGAARDFPKAELIRRYCQERLELLQGLRTFSVFGRGWSARVREVEAVATQMSV